VSGNVRDLANNSASFSFSFTTGTASDLTAPQVTSVNPADGSTGVPTNVDIWIRFDEPIQTPAAAQFVVAAAGVPASVPLVEVSDGNRLVRVRPNVPLNPASVYTLTLVGIEDLAGHPLAAPASFTFTTGPGADLASPSVVSFQPSGTGAATTAVIQATFNEPINTTSIGTSNFRVFLGGTQIAGTVSISADGRTATFVPASPLAPDTLYSVQLFSYTDLAGNGGSFVSWSFRTAP
jgi:hypothetical protein